MIMLKITVRISIITRIIDNKTTYSEDIQQGRGDLPRAPALVQSYPVNRNKWRYILVRL